jgi:bifunctional ADP-heptose synthase (sugar kinase/adenylyltransferase)
LLYGDISIAIKHANKAAGISVSKKGVYCPTFEEMDQFII